LNSEALEFDGKIIEKMSKKVNILKRIFVFIPLTLA
jgi:hypothetical protein